jgi:RNase P subunit RPR2
MNTYQWACKACGTPNVLVHKPDHEVSHISLTCRECGHPGHFDTRAKTLTMLVEEPPATVISTCSTEAYIGTTVYVERLTPRRTLRWTEKE